MTGATPGRSSINIVIEKAAISEKLVAVFLLTRSVIVWNLSLIHICLSCVTPIMLDEFLLEQFELFEQGKFSPWKWRLLRRSCELLKCCAVEDSVDMPPLFPWSPTLRRSRQSIEKSIPTAEQFADPENIFALVWKTNRAMVELGLADATVRHYREEGLAVILKRHYEARTDHFSEDLLSRVITEKRTQYEQGETAKASYQNLRKAAHWLR